LTAIVANSVTTLSKRDEPWMPDALDHLNLWQIQVTLNPDHRPTVHQPRFSALKI
jgi:hypothetical protein